MQNSGLVIIIIAILIILFAVFSKGSCGLSGEKFTPSASSNPNTVAFNLNPVPLAATPVQSSNTFGAQTGNTISYMSNTGPAGPTPATASQSTTSAGSIQLSSNNLISVPSTGSIGQTCISSMDCQSNCCSSGLCAATVNINGATGCAVSGIAQSLPAISNTQINLPINSNSNTMPNLPPSPPKIPAAGIYNGNLFVSPDLNSNSWSGGLYNKNIMAAGQSNSKICALDNQDNIYCNDTGQFTQKQGKLNNISIYGEQAVGVNSADQIWYTNNIFNPYPPWQMVPQPAALKQVSFFGNKYCGVNTANTVWCSNFGSNSFTNLPGVFTDVALGSNILLGVSTGGQLYSYQQNNPTQGWVQIPVNNNPNLTITQAAINNNNMCALGTDKNIYCRPISSNTWTKFNGPYNYLTIDNMS